MPKRKNHIAYFCPSLSWGGLEMNQLRNAKWMQQRGHNVLIFVQEGSRIYQEANKQDLMVVYVKPHKKYFDFVNAFRLIKKINRHQVDHVVVRDPKDMSLCAMAKFWSFKKFFLAYFMEMQIGIPKRDFLHTLRYRRFDLWACPLPWLKKQVMELTKYPKEKIKVIPSGLPLEKYFNAPNQTKAKEMLDLNSTKEYIGLVGRFDKQKRQLLLLEAFHKIKNEINHNLVLLGESTQGESDDYFDQLKSFVQLHNLENRVFFRPFRPDVETFYAAIDVFVMATESETFGMVTIEAMASGCKIVGSNRGGTVEILDHGRLGALFESGNVEDLSMKLLNTIKNDNFETNLVKEAAKKYDAQLICEKVERALEL